MYDIKFKLFIFQQSAFGREKKKDSSIPLK
jgi:hypothetical protein